MRIELEKMKKPIGTRDSPARSCKDLFYGHPQLKDGKLACLLTRAEVVVIKWSMCSPSTL